MSLDWTALSRDTLPATGPVAFDADLSAPNIFAAASHGFYCFPASSYEEAMLNEIRYAADAESGSLTVNEQSSEPYSVAWFNPDPRPVAELTTRRTGRTMRRFARRRAEWRTSINAAFDQVVNACAQTHQSTWITDTLRPALQELHEQGLAHSCEVWHDGELIGGVFGLQLGAVLSADSQFTLVEGAGKIAVVDLMTRFLQGGGRLFDFQHDSQHATNLGAKPMPRAAYLQSLRQLIEKPVHIPHEQRSAEHLAELVTT
ncbi:MULTISPECIES: leucyl/phenylalanyl-tRNA--protein transferase [Micrococcales]|uniref:Leucyl/phenylalanyl-tRNA--protein transferase n=1 Tax=Brevibacterium casei TaxID=33889 RepID=A0A269Z6Z3_9MICO|nr:MULTISPECIES: GNAT family N-acetyltransferase [Micrococcales]MCJ2194774.1 GNAT family N-acetyltransferase [Kaistella montana]KZE91715.1 Leucyl/phenylalanyl-tRNA--protein transferase [Microbacterium sp. TNHR37B]MCT1446281.1 GNAT family N-acetyltransferase [Brevibacterium casei]NYF28607.1 leucyl/phenylalanyl-tRNA--protein transferase [Microbacterium sp. JAI119]PAK93555.1 hypothetical protein B8X04_15425 [Brevibacterium casei]